MIRLTRLSKNISSFVAGIEIKASPPLRKKGQTGPCWKKRLDCLVVKAKRPLCVCERLHGSDLNHDSLCRS